MNMFNLSIEEDWRKIKMVKVTVEEKYIYLLEKVTVVLKKTVLEERKMK